jgi:hypothetical protein
MGNKNVKDLQESDQELLDLIKLGSRCKLYSAGIATEHDIWLDEKKQTLYWNIAGEQRVARDAFSAPLSRITDILVGIQCKQFLLPRSQMKNPNGPVYDAPLPDCCFTVVYKNPLYQATDMSFVSSADLCDLSMSMDWSDPSTTEKEKMYIQQQQSRANKRVLTLDIYNESPGLVRAWLRGLRLALARSRRAVVTMHMRGDSREARMQQKQYRTMAKLVKSQQNLREELKNALVLSLFALFTFGLSVSSVLCVL